MTNSSGKRPRHLVDSSKKNKEWSIKYKEWRMKSKINRETELQMEQVIESGKWKIWVTQQGDPTDSPLWHEMMAKWRLCNVERQFLKYVLPNGWHEGDKNEQGEWGDAVTVGRVAGGSVMVDQRRKQPQIKAWWGQRPNVNYQRYGSSPA
jgi:hypothetical protein